MIVIKGGVAPNEVGWRSWLIPILKELGIKRLQVLVYEEATIEDQILDMMIVQAAIPDIELTLRFYAQNILTFDAGTWARSRRRMLNRIMAAGIRVTAVILANEPNIELPPELRENWDYQAQWYVDAANAWYSESGPYVDLDLPAGSPTPAFLSEGLDVYEAHGLGQIFHRLNAHCYPGSERAYEELIARWPHARIAITEFNGIDPEKYLSSLPAAVEEADWFTLKWINPPAGSPSVDLIGSEYYESFARSLVATNIPAGNISANQGGKVVTAHDLFNNWYDELSGQGYNPDTALGKLAQAHPELGIPLGPETEDVLNDVSIVRRFFVGGIGLARKSDWKTAIARTEAELANPFD